MKTTRIALSILFIGIVAISASAKDVSVDASEIKKAAELAQGVLKKVQPSTVEVDDIRRTPEIPNLDMQGAKIQATQPADPMQIAQEMKSQIAQQNRNIDPTILKSGDLIVFVSTSMPEASLKRIARETAKIGGVMMLRGFVNDSLMQTVSNTKELANLGAEIQINPDLFRAYEVESVPTFVLAINPQSQAGCVGKAMCQSYVKLEGDASLSAVLERMTQSQDKKMAALATAKAEVLRGVQP